jgi:hypothetical protein
MSRDFDEPSLVTARRASTSMSRAILVRVTTEFDANSDRATALWIVATDDPETAVRTVREKVVLGCIIEATDHQVTESTIERLGLAAGQVWHL